MQIGHVRPGDEAQLATLLEDHERHYGEEGRGPLAGFAILNAYFPPMGPTHRLLEKVYYAMDL